MCTVTPTLPLGWELVPSWSREREHGVAFPTPRYTPSFKGELERGSAAQTYGEEAFSHLFHLLACLTPESTGGRVQPVSAPCVQPEAVPCRAGAPQPLSPACCCLCPRCSIPTRPWEGFVLSRRQHPPAPSLLSPLVSGAFRVSEIAPSGPEANCSRQAFLFPLDHGTSLTQNYYCGA